ncbi:MAG TPA: hypothetical protein VNK52_16550 [Hyphomicrobiaceae bacterium]|nr:hypothetical protein [Hyphomicrobiaceae bacterium]
MIIKRSGAALKALALVLSAGVVGALALPASPAEAGKKKVNVIINVGGGPYIGGYGYGYAGFGGCWWLKKKALKTGSPYWWNQYYLCKLYN